MKIAFRNEKIDANFKGLLRKKTNELLFGKAGVSRDFLSTTKRLVGTKLLKYIYNCWNYVKNNSSSVLPRRATRYIVYW